MAWKPVIILTALAVTGCGADDPPTAEQLAERLITVDTFDGDWTDNAPPEAADGLVPEEFQEMLPRMDLCDAASDASRAAVLDQRWAAFRQLDLDVEDPIRPPDDRTGHLVFVQEFLTSGPASDLEATFGLLRDGMVACLGDIPAGEEGPGFAVEMIVPDIGDERYGVLTTIEEAGGWAEWRLHSVMVRDGDVLAVIVITDIRADSEPYYSIDDVGEMVTTALALP